MYREEIRCIILYELYFNIVITYRCGICKSIIIGMQTQDECLQINQKVDLKRVYYALSLDKLVEVAVVMLHHMHATDSNVMTNVWRKPCCHRYSCWSQE
jgi:hypothetical protein